VSRPRGDDVFVFNIVWTGDSYTYLRHFVVSQIANSAARFRFVANACHSTQLAEMRAFAAADSERVIEVMEVSSTDMVPHGIALERVLSDRDDGEFFCFADSDILARGPFVADFAGVLADGCDAVTSGRGVWAETDVVPEGHPGVNGEYFYSRDGYLFGSPHFAMYRRQVLDEVRERWQIGFGSAGPDLGEEAQARLAAAGLDFWLFDTGKLVNIFLQEDGGVLRHEEHPNLMHIGGMSHYLSPPDRTEAAGRSRNPDWATWDPSRLEVARYSAEVLMAAADGAEVPAIPVGLAPTMAQRLEVVRGEILALVRSGQET
jgi:hypothetical protein